MLSLSGVLPAFSAVPSARNTNDSMNSFAGQFTALLEQFLQQAKMGSTMELGITLTGVSVAGGTPGFTIAVQGLPAASMEQGSAGGVAANGTSAKATAPGEVLSQPPPQYVPPAPVMVLTRLASAPPSMAPVLRPDLESRLQQLVPRWEPGVAPYISGVDRQYVFDSFRGEAKYWTSLFPGTTVDPAAQESLVQKYSGMVFDWMAQAPANAWGNAELSGSMLDHLADLPKGNAMFTPAALDPVTRQITFPVTAASAG